MNRFTKGVVNEFDDVFYLEGPDEGEYGTTVIKAMARVDESSPFAILEKTAEGWWKLSVDTSWDVIPEAAALTGNLYKRYQDSYSDILKVYESEGGKQMRTQKYGAQKAGRSAQSIMRDLSTTLDMAQSVEEALYAFYRKGESVPESVVSRADDVLADLKYMQDDFKSFGIADTEVDDIAELASLVRADAEILAYGQEGEEEYEGIDAYQASAYAGELVQDIENLIDEVNAMSKNRTRSRKYGTQKVDVDNLVNQLRDIHDTSVSVYNAMDRLVHRPTGVIPTEIEWAQSLEADLMSVYEDLDAAYSNFSGSDLDDMHADLLDLARIVATDAEILAYGQEGEEDYEGIDAYQAVSYADELERKLDDFIDELSTLQVNNRKIGGMLGNTIASKPKRPMKPKPGDDKKPEKPKRLRRREEESMGRFSRRSRIQKATGYDAIDMMDTIFDDRHFDTARNMDSAGRKSKSFLEDFAEMDAPSEFKGAQTAVEEFLFALSDWWTVAEESADMIYDMSDFEDEYGNIDYDEVNYQRDKDMDMFARDADNAEMKFLDEWRKLDEMYGE